MMFICMIILLKWSATPILISPYFTLTDIGIIIGGVEVAGGKACGFCSSNRPNEKHTLDQLGMHTLDQSGKSMGPCPTIAQHIFCIDWRPTHTAHTSFCRPIWRARGFHSFEWVCKLQWFLGLLLFCSRSLWTQQFCWLKWLNFNSQRLNFNFNGSISTPMAQFEWLLQPTCL